MAEYKAIRGHTIRTIAGDASPLVAGDIWYNSSSKTIRGAKLPAGTWASGGDLNRTRNQGRQIMKGAGPSSAAIAVGGHYTTVAPAQVALVEQYDGSSWTEVGDINTARWNVGTAGTQTATLAAAGQISGDPATVSDTEEFNGTSWTEVTNLDTDRGSGAGCGTQTAALFIGGVANTTVSVLVEEYDGTNWTEIADINTGRSNYASFQKGTTTAAMIASGYTTTFVDITETFDGSTWTEVGDVNTARNYLGGFGTAASGLVFGGESPSLVDVVEEWDGTSWTETTDLPAATQTQGGAGTGTSGIAYGGTTAVTPLATTLEWSRATAAVTFTSS